MFKGQIGKIASKVDIDYEQKPNCGCKVFFIRVRLTNRSFHQLRSLRSYLVFMYSGAQ